MYHNMFINISLSPQQIEKISRIIKTDDITLIEYYFKSQLAILVCDLMDLIEDQDV